MNWSDISTEIVPASKRYVCSKCDAICRATPDRYDRGRTAKLAADAGLELPDYAKRVKKNTATYGSHKRHEYPIVVCDVIHGQKQGPSIKCRACATAEVEAAALAKAGANEAERAQLLADARERFPDEAAVRAEARKQGLRYAARLTRLGYEQPKDVKRIDRADSGTKAYQDGPLGEAWRDAFDQARRDAVTVLRDHFPEMED